VFGTESAERSDVVGSQAGAAHNCPGSELARARGRLTRRSECLAIAGSAASRRGSFAIGCRRRPRAGSLDVRL